MADDLDDFFDDVDQAETKAVEEQQQEEADQPPPAKKQKVIRPQGVVVAAASSAVVHAPPAKTTATSAAGPIGPQIPSSASSSIPLHNRQSKAPSVASSAAVPPPPKPPPLPKKPHYRTAAGKTWVDKSLDDWPDDDFRIFVGSLGPEVTDQQLFEHFQKYSSLQLAKVVRDNKTQVSKCYGFVSLGDALECAKALREQDQSWLGSRPIRLKRSTWKDREMSKKKKKKRR